jgi:hypothetical protein
MKLALSSTAVANMSHFPAEITGAIVSSGWGDDVVGCSYGKHSGEFDMPSDRPAKRNRGDYEYRQL